MVVSTGVVKLPVVWIALIVVIAGIVVTIASLWGMVITVALSVLAIISPATSGGGTIIPNTIGVIIIPAMPGLAVARRNIQDLAGVNVIGVSQAIGPGNMMGIDPVIAANAVERVAIVNPVMCSARGRSN